ncbi:MAG: ornithine carbamoyltransferase [Piscirickettsiaceae bacterium]|nr:MAG: ornithine carbamoyltransferase [Piscirickettsiaceae bacterium]
MKSRHFITLNDLSAEELRYIIHRAIELKRMRADGETYEPLKNKVLGMVFEKSSTRTRISFEAGMAQFGGSAIFLSPRDTQLGRGEPIEDSARVMSRMLDGIMLRTNDHQTVVTFAEHSNVPVINGLTDRFHPCQLLADLQTWFEIRGDIQGKKVCWVGDGNNMCQSYMNAAKLLDFELTIACPDGYQPEAQLLAATSSNVTLLHDTQQAARAADLVVTDVWASMGQEQEQKIREKAFANFQVNEQLMSIAKPDALFMHCLPAHRDEEVSTAVLDGKQSVVWQEAENRLHAQKALLEFLMHQKI